MSKISHLILKLYLEKETHLKKFERLFSLLELFISHIVRLKQ